MSGLGRARRATRAVTMASSLAAGLLAVAQAASMPRWPSDRYRRDPVAYFREVLGVEPWEKQIEVIEAIRDHKRVSIRAGHKVSKSNTAAGIALWFYCSFDDAKVVMTSTTDRQVNEILWEELRRMIARAGRCGVCRARDPFGGSRCAGCEDVRPIPEEPSVLARTGLKAADFRSITGFTAKEAEGAAGKSGKNLLYIIDESSGVPDAVYEAIRGNSAGGAKIAAFGNPTRCEGWFFRSHTDNKEAWDKVIHISSKDSPNVVQGREVIPGLATREWVLDMAAEWGEDSAVYQVRVEGNYAREDEYAVIPLYLVEQAEELWKDKNLSPRDRLHVGLDCARFGDDESVAIPRRGNRVIDIHVWRKLDEKELAFHVIQTIRQHRRPREPKPIVKVDACGTIGIKVVAELAAYQDEIEIVAVNVSERSRLPRQYRLLRDQLWFALRTWLKEGGAIPEDLKLEAELLSPRFSYDEKGRQCVESKDEIRKRLKRSPDRADALALAVWEPAIFQPDHPDDETTDDDGDGEAAQLDPYGGALDPYAGGIGA